MVQTRAWEGPWDHIPAAAEPIAAPIGFAPTVPEAPPPSFRHGLTEAIQALVYQAMKLQTAFLAIPAAAAQYMGNLRENLLNSVGGLIEQWGINAQERRGGIREDEYIIRQGNAYNEYGQAVKKIGGEFVGRFFNRSSAMLLLLDKVRRGEGENPEHIQSELRILQEASRKLDVILQDAVDKRRMDLAVTMMKYTNLVQVQGKDDPPPGVAPPGGFAPPGVEEPPSFRGGVTEMVQALIYQAMRLPKAICYVVCGDWTTENLLNTIAQLVEQWGINAQERRGGIREDEYAMRQGNAYNEYGQTIQKILPNSRFGAHTSKTPEKNFFHDGAIYLEKYYERSAQMLILLDRLEKGEEKHPEQIFDDLLRVQKTNAKLDAMIFDAIAKR